MKTILFLFSVLIIQFVIFCPISFCTQIASHNIDIMEIKNIKPGMRGYGTSVFSGTKIEKFDVEILGVLKNYEAKRDMILVQLYGPVVEKAGIISGMSGSPIYINGKLIGALSYAWAFSKDPIAGVTPISEMLHVLDEDTKLPIDEHKIPPNVVEPYITDASINGKLVPIKTPLMVSGFTNRMFDIMQPEFDMLGMTPIQCGGNVDIKLNDQTLTPGSAVAVQLIRGDLNASAIGTVTYKEGNNILAFGHPFLQMGNVDLAMSGAYVHTTLANQSLSVKMASPTKIVGRVTQDRKAAISGIIGEFAKMIPCHVKISSTNKIEYDFEIAHNDLFTKNLCQMGFLSAILSTENQIGEVVVTLGIKIFIDDLEKPIEFENIFYDANSGIYPVAQITQPIDDLLNNRFKRVQIKRIELNAEFLDDPKVAFIDQLSIDKNIVSPGDTVNVTVSLNPYNVYNIIKKTINIEIPNNMLPKSNILISACSPNHSKRLSMERSPGKYKPANFQQLIELINDIEANNEIIIRVLLQKNGISFNGVQFPSLPSSLLYIMSLPKYSGTETLFTEKIFRIKTDWIIEGNQSLLIFSKET